MATSAEKRAYARTLSRLATRYDRLEAATLRDIVSLLRELRREIAGQVGLSDFSALRVRELTAAIDRLLASTESQLLALVGQSLNGAQRHGVDFVAQPLRAADVEVRFFAPSPQQVQIMADFSADLIRGVTAETRRLINAQLRLGVLGGSSPYSVMQEVTRILGLLPRQRGGVVYKAERIVRTEMGRVFNLAAQGQMGEIDGALKRWVATGDDRTRATHLRAHLTTLDRPIPTGQRFQVGASRLLYPGDPAGEAKETINCRCRGVVVHPDLGVIRTRLDQGIETELETR